MDNFLIIAAVGAGAFVVAFLVAVLSSERVHRQGLFGALGRELSDTSRRRNPYRS